MRDSGAHAVQSVPAAAGEVGFLRLLRQALTGRRHDYTALPLRRAIFLLAVPMVLEMITNSIFAIVDIFFVSKLGPDAVAAVALTEQMVILLYAVAAGLGIGVTAVVARRTGEKDAEGAARAAAQSILIGLAVAAAVGLVGSILAPQLLAVMGASPEVVAVGSGYTRVIMAGSLCVFLLFLINSAFRGAGDATVAMRTLWLANAVNIVLCPLLIFGWGPVPAFGVTGAAIGTVIGRGTGVLYQLRALAAGRGHLAVRRRHLRPDLETIRSILRICRSSIVQVLVSTTSWIPLVRLMSEFGSAALAGYGIATRIIMFAIMPAWGMANAAATLVGQNLGAGLPQRSEQAVWRAAFYNLIFLGGIGLVFVVFSRVIVGAFSTDPAVVAYGSTQLRIVSAGFLFYAYGMVLTQAFNGAGDTRTPTRINVFCFWLGEIPLAWLLSGPLGLGPTGIYIAILVAFSAYAIASLILFRRGAWKSTKV